MNYKVLLHRILLLISSPAKAWEEISLDEGRYNVAVHFVYPLMGVCGLVVFIGTIVNKGFSSVSYQIAMLDCAALFISLFGGFFMASALVNWYGMKVLKRVSQSLLCQTLVGYSMVVIFVLHILLGLFPEFRILQLLLQFYTLYIVWEGAKRIMQVAEGKLMSYTIAATFFILISPIVINFIFDLLSKLMR